MLMLTKQPRGRSKSQLWGKGRQGALDAITYLSWRCLSLTCANIDVRMCDITTGMGVQTVGCCGEGVEAAQRRTYRRTRESR